MCNKGWNDRSYPLTEKMFDGELSIPMNHVFSVTEAKEVEGVLNSFK